MFEVFRRKIIKNILQMGIVMFGTFAILYVLESSAYEIGIPDVLGKTTEITAGTSLAQYKNKKVSCDIQYVLNHVVSFYDRGDPAKEIYTCGYVVLDENMQNPFCVFVPVSKQELMQTKCSQTWIMYVNETKSQAEPIKVEGYVRQLNDENKHYYIEALNEMYGEGYANSIGNVYYIDDENAAKKNVDVHIQLGMFAILVGLSAWIAVVIIQGSYYRKDIKMFAVQNGTSTEGLENEFRLAEQITDTFWISPQYTFFVHYAKVKIIKNTDIVWAFKKAHHGKVITYTIELYTIMKKRYSGIQMGEDVERILQYYERTFPFIVTREDPEKRRLFENDFMGFLQLQYMKYRDI